MDIRNDQMTVKNLPRAIIVGVVLGVLWAVLKDLRKPFVGFGWQQQALILGTAWVVLWTLVPVLTLRIDKWATYVLGFLLGSVAYTWLLVIGKWPMSARAGSVVFTILVLVVGDFTVYRLEKRRKTSGREIEEE